MPDDIYYDEQSVNNETVTPANARADFLRRLMNVQRKLRAPKNSYNSFGKYYFRSCEDILENAKPLLEENELFLTLNDEVVVVNDRFYIKAFATVYDMNSDESIFTTAFAREPENRKGSDQSQVTGSSSTYARKYALNGLFLIDDNKDADDPQGQQKPKEPPAQGPFVARCVSCGTQYQFADANQYRQFLTNPQCCANPNWVVA